MPSPTSVGYIIATRELQRDRIEVEKLSDLVSGRDSLMHFILSSLVC